MRVEAESRILQSVILPNVVIGSGCRIRKAIIDKECIVPAGTVIVENRTEDQQRFYVSPDGVVLVTPEMLGQMFHRVR